MTVERIVSDHQIVDHGIDNSQYFPGCGVSFTPYEDCFTGCADNPHEALEDALDLAAMSGWNIESIENELPDKPSVSEQYPVEEDEQDSGSEMYYYVSIRVRGPQQDKGDQT